MANSKGLIFLDSKSAILREELSSRIIENKRQPCEISFADFDGREESSLGIHSKQQLFSRIIELSDCHSSLLLYTDVSFKISCSPDSLSVVKVNMNLRNLAILKRLGSQKVIDREFPGMEIVPEVGYMLCLQFDCDKLKDPKRFLEQISDLKKLVFCGPMDLAFTALQCGTSRKTAIVTLEYRPNEYIFICPTESKVVVIFMVDFVDVTDKAIAKVFLQEFVESQRSIRSAPPVSYSKDPPGELNDVSYKHNADSAGYLSFALEGRHVEGARKESAINLLSGFRTYLHYHIKCTKTYLHMRMRQKGANWMQVLNRALPDVETEKKTIAGKTFVRK